MTWWRHGLGPCLLALSSVALMGGCEKLRFDVSADDAPVVVLDVPGALVRDGFGNVVTAFNGPGRDGQPSSRLAISSGPDTPFAVYPVWEEGALVLDAPRFRGCDGGEETECSPGFGATLAGFPYYIDPADETRQLCLLVGAPEASDFRVVCESRAHEAVLGIDQPGTGVTTSAVGLGEGGTEHAVALLGAPEEDGGRGAVHLLPEHANAGTKRVTFDALVLEEGASLGTEIAAAPLAEGGALFAASAAGAGKVVVAELDADGEVELRGCLDAGDGVEALAVGDVTGSRRPDVILGGGETARVFDGQDIDALGMLGCGAGAPAALEPLRLQCPEGLRDAECNEGGFGAALAVADVDGRDKDELLVGAPDATVDGVDGAGAVYVFPSRGRDGPDAAAAVALVRTSPKADERLGAALTAVATGLEDEARYEPVAGAPGAGKVLVFLCSGLEGDTPDGSGARCLP